MSPFKPAEVVNSLLSEIAALPDEGGRELLDEILQPAHDMELYMRRLFATARDSPCLLDPHLGLIDLFSISDKARLTRPRSHDGPRNVFYDVYSGMLCTFPTDPIFPLDPQMQRPQGAPCIVENMDIFLKNWRIFTHGALANMPDWNNVIAAGGSVLGCLSPVWPKLSGRDLNEYLQSNAYASSDIDLFLWGLTEDQAEAKIVEIYTSISTSVIWPVTCVRKAKTISIHGTWPQRIIQIILHLYKSPAEVLAGFDVDSSACAYDGQNVWLSPRALVACIKQANSIDITRRSPSYEVRLAKYASRGFEVYFPALNRNRVDYLTFYNGGIRRWPFGLARLLVLEILRFMPYHYYFLYRSSGTVRNPFIGPKNAPKYDTLNFAQIDKLTENDYDNLWIRVPYGLEWTPAKVKQFVDKIDFKMNSRFNTINDERHLHRHAAFCSPNIKKCLGQTCRNCPPPVNAMEKALIEKEALMYFRGPIKFVTENLVRQIITGSFQPIDTGDWAGEACRLLPGVSPFEINDDSIDYKSIWARHCFRGAKYGVIYTQDPELFGLKEGDEIPLNGWEQVLYTDDEQSGGTSYYSNNPQPSSTPSGAASDVQ